MTLLALSASMCSHSPSPCMLISTSSSPPDYTLFSAGLENGHAAVKFRENHMATNELRVDTLVLAVLVCVSIDAPPSVSMPLGDPNSSLFSFPVSAPACKTSSSPPSYMLSSAASNDLRRDELPGESDGQAQAAGPSRYTGSSGMCSD